MKENLLVPRERIISKIYLIRGKKVMLDRDLAELYQVRTMDLNKAVKRNLDRFPEDFAFRLSRIEFNDLIFQIGISRWGGTRIPPMAFTEQGVAMLSSVLRSKRAIQANIQIVRTFTKIRQMLAGNRNLRLKIEEMERKYDKQFKDVFDAIRRLIQEEEKPKKILGFRDRRKTKDN